MKQERELERVFFLGGGGKSFCGPPLKEHSRQREE